MVLMPKVSKRREKSKNRNAVIDLVNALGNNINFEPLGWALIRKGR